MMSSSEWMVILTTGGTPVLILPDIRRTVVAKMRVFLLKGEVLLGPGLGELQELEELLQLLHVTLQYQVHS